MKLLLIDNYDSFTYNLVHLINVCGQHDITVVRNDQISLETVEDYDKIVISPGPGTPKDTGICPAVVAAYYQHKPILGVCMGHQVIATCFGAQLFNLKQVLHGVTSEITPLIRSGLYKNLPKKFPIGHYHSWAIRTDQFPEDLTITSQSDDGYVLSFSHKHYPVYGLQFHPESILTPHGHLIMTNFLAL